MGQYRLTIYFVTTFIVVNITATSVNILMGQLWTTVLAMGSLFLILTGFVVTADLAITRYNRRLQEQEREAERIDYLQESRRRIVAAEEGVRRTVAQQLHGSVQNRLIVALHRLKKLQAAGGSEPLTQELIAIHQDLADLQQTEVRSISRQLYPPIVRLGLIPALRSLRDQMSTALRVELLFDEVLAEREQRESHLISEQIRLAAYRITEEALTNVVKHAGVQAATVRVSLPSDGLIHVEVQDSGQGFDTSRQSESLGLASLQDYAETLGGHCEVQSSPGHGTIIEVALPLGAP